MSVVFDEVTATIETPDTTASAAEESEPEQDSGNPAERFLQLMETRNRRSKRLWAD